MEAAYDKAEQNEKAGDYLTQLIDSGNVEIDENGIMIINENNGP